MQQDYDVAAIMGALYGEGSVGLQGGLQRDLVESLHRQCLSLYEEASFIEAGAVRRGPNRWYVEVQPERVEAFVDIVAHPWFVAVSEAALGSDYKIVELGFDIPFPGAADQPWHRDFPGDSENATGLRISSLAFNITTVDTRPDHGALRDRAGHPMGHDSGGEVGHVPPARQVGSLSLAWGRQAAAAGRYFGAHRPHHAPRNRKCVGGAKTGSHRRRCRG